MDCANSVKKVNKSGSFSNYLYEYSKNTSLNNNMFDINVPINTQ